MSIKEFIDAYKKLENTVSSLEQAPETDWLPSSFTLSESPAIFDLESECTDSSIKSKLKLCRTIRNYCQHEKDFKSFVAVTPAMVRFLEGISADLESGFTTTKDVMKKITALKETDSVKDALNTVSKKGYVPVMNDQKECIAVLSAMDICGLINSGARTTAKLKTLLKKQSLQCVQQDIPYAELKNLKEVLVVTDKKGTYKGLIF